MFVVANQLARAMSRACSMSIVGLLIGATQYGERQTLGCEGHGLRRPSLWPQQPVAPASHIIACTALLAASSRLQDPRAGCAGAARYYNLLQALTPTGCKEGACCVCIWCVYAGVRNPHAKQRSCVYNALVLGVHVVGVH